MVFSGLILAGGQSRRMGRDKALLNHDGLTLLACAQALMHKAGAEQILVSRNEAAPVNEAAYVADVWPGRGPLSGIHAGLLQAAHDIIVIMPVDMPQLRHARLQQLVATLETLADTARTDNADPAPAAVHFAHHVLPCALRVSAALIEQLEQIVGDAQANYSLTRFLKSLGSHVMALDADAEFANINTPDEFAQLSQGTALADQNAADTVHTAARPNTHR